MGIIFGIISALKLSLANIYRKKAIDNSNISGSMIYSFWSFSGLIVILSLILLLPNYSFNYLTYYFLIFLIFINAIIEIIYSHLNVYILKKAKISSLLPYSNADKLFIILIGFFIFYGTSNSTSITTFLISLGAIFIVIASSIDRKNLKLDKIVILYLFGKVLSAITALLMGYILVQMTTINYLSINIIFLSLLIFIVILLKKEKFGLYKSQNKSFYKPMLLSVLFGWIGYIVSIFLIKDLGLLVATLIGFIGLAFSIFSMKFILKDNPSKKEVIIATLVTILIGIGFYFK